MKLLDSIYNGNGYRTMYISFSESMTKETIDRFTSQLSERYNLIWRGKRTPLSPVVKKEILKADEFGIAVTPDIERRPNRTVTEDIPFLVREGKYIESVLTDEEDQVYLNMIDRIEDEVEGTLRLTGGELDAIDDVLQEVMDEMENDRAEAYRKAYRVEKALLRTRSDSGIRQIHMKTRSLLLQAEMFADIESYEDCIERLSSASSFLGKVVTADNIESVGQFLSIVHGNIAETYLLDGEYGKAMESCRKLYSILHEVDEDYVPPRGYHVKVLEAEALIRLGRLDEAEELISETEKEVQGLYAFIRKDAMKEIMEIRKELERK